MTLEAIPDRTSRVPHFTFADTLAAQEAQLAENPLTQRFRKSRCAFLKDPHRPRYHFVSPESSHGPVGRGTRHPNKPRRSIPMDEYREYGMPVTAEFLWLLAEITAEDANGK